MENAEKPSLASCQVWSYGSSASSSRRANCPIFWGGMICDSRSNRTFWWLAGSSCGASDSRCCCWRNRSSSRRGDCLGSCCGSGCCRCCCCCCISDSCLSCSSSRDSAICSGCFPLSCCTSTSGCVELDAIFPIGPAELPSSSRDERNGLRRVAKKIIRGDEKPKQTESEGI